MGAGASQEFAQAIAPNTNKRHGMGKRKAAQKAQADMNRQLLEKYDKDKTGALTREEVRAFAEDVLSRHIEPPHAFHLDLMRLTNFAIRLADLRESSMSGNVHIYEALPKRGWAELAVTSS